MVHVFGYFLTLAIFGDLMQRLKLLLIKYGLFQVREVITVLYSQDFLVSLFYCFDCFSTFGQDGFVLVCISLVCVVSYAQGLHDRIWDSIKWINRFVKAYLILYIFGVYIYIYRVYVFIMRVYLCIYRAYHTKNN